ncbi:Alanine dehydrogenase PNT and Saccharopine dehydrogenase domain containing protein [Aphelenchoides besseyi]|nr:Alanine dehydrogenase PNT and Saccharopine dehydrogenase domain containing protein [Aphelenchoides besseyi]
MLRRTLFRVLVLRRGSQSTASPCLGIRRETINPWERRAPIAPQHDYIAAGAVPQEDLSPAQLILSVKQVPVEQLLPNTTYAFFSHTIKAQPDNMEMLDTILHRICAQDGSRLVMFGKWAGFAGFIDILHGLGLRLLALGHHTPFLHVALAHNYSDSHMAINAVRDCGYEIALDRLPHSLGPLIFVFTGTGNVSQDMNKVYGCVVSRSDHLIRKKGGKFDKKEFDKHPERYVSKFASEIPDAKHLLTPTARPHLDLPGCPSLPHRLIAICDISADPNGSIEFMTECTTIDKPFVMYDADFNMSYESFHTPSGCLVCSIDNMPAQLPLEATEQFGNLLFPYINDMNAIITSDGKLTPNFRYIEDLRQDQKNQLAQKAKVMADGAHRILLLGAGMVSDPLAYYYSQHSNIHLTVATDSPQDGKRLRQIGDNINSLVLDVLKEPDVIDDLVQKHDLVISLLPFTFHPSIAKLCIKHRTNMVTSSYISPELQALNEEAQAAKITIMNEAGLDPGIDHMLAMECIDRVHEMGGKISSFVSFCGGLPAPEVSSNALRYKFSWSPKGMLLALMNPARYLQNGEVIEVAGDGAVLDDLHPIDFMPGFNLIGYANRDSTKYAEIYGIEKECQTLIRGTLRYKGFVEAIKGLKSAGLLSSEKRDFLSPMNGPDLTWKQLMARLHAHDTDIPTGELRRLIGARLETNSKGLRALDELGLFSDCIPDRRLTPLDTLVPHLAKALAYAPGERDLVVLNHDIEAQLPAGSTSQLIATYLQRDHFYVVISDHNAEDQVLIVNLVSRLVQTVNCKALSLPQYPKIITSIDSTETLTIHELNGTPNGERGFRFRSLRLPIGRPEGLNNLAWFVVLKTSDRVVPLPRHGAFTSQPQPSSASRYSLVERRRFPNPKILGSNPSSG